MTSIFQEKSATSIKNNRVNTDLEKAVNCGIATAELVGNDAALCYMNEVGIPPSIINRVIKSKSHRRSSIWK